MQYTSFYFLGISPNKDGRFQIDDVFFTAEEIKKNFGIGLGDKNGQPDESKRWPKGKKYPCKYLVSLRLCFVLILVFSLYIHTTKPDYNHTDFSASFT